MKSERVQFDQLAAQNLSSIWRQNAFSELLASHQSFRVETQAASGYILELLGDAFYSNRDGAVSKARIEGRILGLFFRGNGRSDSAACSALRSIHDNYKGGKGLAFEVVQVSDNSTNSVRAFREFPWLAVPFTHERRRRQLLKFFSLSEIDTCVVLLNQEGQIITRDGLQILAIAHSCQRMQDKVLKSSKSSCEDSRVLQRERKKLSEQEKMLLPLDGVVSSTKQMMSVLDASELREIEDFIAEPSPSLDAARAVTAAGDALAAARKGVAQLPDEELEAVRTADSPSPDLRSAVEAVAVLCELKADFELAKARLMRSATGFKRRITGLHPASLPKTA